MKRYTAQEMREAARDIKAYLALAETDDVMYRSIAMLRQAGDLLRQAADDLEREEKRERKYEYAEKFKEGMVACLHRERPVDHCEMYPGSIAVRRTVGEWEEVRDDSCEDR